MVDLVVLQSLSYTAGALSVILGVIYYAINLRESTKNRRINTTATLLQSMLSREMVRMEGSLMELEWKDFDDFYSKYDSSVNIENYADRTTMMCRFDLVGYLLKCGLVDIDTLYCFEGVTMLNAWVKFKLIVEEYRKFSWGKDAFEYWEYLANEVAKYKAKRDPLYRYNARGIFTPEEYERTFGKYLSQLVIS
jgi:hypothetical protein